MLRRLPSNSSAPFEVDVVNVGFYIDVSIFPLVNGSTIVVLAQLASGGNALTLTIVLLFDSEFVLRLQPLFTNGAKRMLWVFFTTSFSFSTVCISKSFLLFFLFPFPNIFFISESNQDKFVYFQ